MGIIATSVALAQPADQFQWPMATMNYANTRYSELNQINQANAKDLKLAWTFSTGVFRGQEAAPLIVGDTMYVVSPFPNYLFAIDLAHPPQLKWTFDPKPDAAAKGEACCDWVNRGAAYADGRIYYNLLDCHTVAVDAKTGKEVWRTEIGQVKKGETITMAPMVVKNHVYVGISGGEMGVRGRLTCLDTATGKVQWRAWSTGPDKDCLIGPNFKPYYDSEKGTDLGVKTWPPNHWQIGGGTIWGFLSYDPELNLVFYGTGNPGSWNPDLRPGDNKWSCGIFARDADTGEARWFYQTSPHDLFDHDGINECMLLDLKMDGPDKPARKCLVHPGRTGYMYVLDRTSGEVISAEPFGRITCAKGVDLKTGRLIINEEKKPQLGKVIRDIQPASPGMKDWQPTAYSPRTQLLYVPHQNLACDYETVEANYIAGTPYLGVNERMYAGPAEKPGQQPFLGRFMAWDLVNRKRVWSIDEAFPCWSGTLVTAGDVCFYGTMDKHFKVVDAKTGKVLWDFETDSGIIGQPVTYKGPDGKQYVAILAGVGGWSGAVVSGQLDTRDPTGALGFVNAMKDLPKRTPPGDKLYVFALP